MSSYHSISVIMPVTLADYPGAASNRPYKFVRAVDSFLDNTYVKKDLIIVSDGCSESIKIYKDKYERYHNVHLVKLDKQPLFSGQVRQSGINYALAHLQTSIFVGLDCDDYYHHSHLSNIAEKFGDNDFIYFDDFWNRNGEIERHEVTLQHMSCGTSSLAWRNKPEFSWSGCDGFGHDNMFRERLMKHSDKYEKIDGCGYVICHIQNLFDC